MAYSDDLITQAQSAINRGADPEAVSRELQRMLSLMGEGDKQWALKSDPRAASDAADAARAYWQDTANAYRNAVVPSVIQESKMVADSPRGQFSNVEAGSASTAADRTKLAYREAIGDNGSLLSDVLNNPVRKENQPDANGRLPGSEGYDPISAELLARGEWKQPEDIEEERRRIEAAESWEDREKARKEYQGGLLYALKQGTLGGATRPLSGLLRAIPTDKAQETADELRALAKGSEPSLSGEHTTGQNLARMVGGVAPLWATVYATGGLAGGGIIGAGEGASAAEDAVEAGASPLQATLYGASMGAAYPVLNELAPGFGTGLRGAIARGAANAGLGAGSREISNLIGPDSLQQDVLNPYAVGADALFGALFPNRPVRKLPKAPEPATPRSGDPAIDSGMAAVDELAGSYDFAEAAKRQRALIEGRLEPEQGDMLTISGESAVQGDLFGKPIDASLAEARRAEDAESRVTRHPDQQAALERGYLQSRRERLLQEQEAADAATREQGLLELESQHKAGDNAEPESTHPDFWNVGVPRNEQPADRTLTVNPETGLDAPVGYSEYEPNNAMRDAFDRAGTRRALGLKDENLYPDIRNKAEPSEPAQPELFPEPPESDVPAVSRNETVEPQQTQLAFPEQGDMFNRGDTPNKFKPYSAGTPLERRANRNAIAAATRTPAADIEASLAEARKTREAFARAIGGDEADIKADVPAYTAPGMLPFLPKTHGIPASILGSLEKGTLTARNVYDAIANNLHDIDGRAPEVGAFVQQLREAAKRFGGEDISIEIFDPKNQSHIDLLNASPGRAATLKTSRAAYLPAEHRILLFQDVGLGTIIHEMDHAVRERVLTLGEKGTLNPKAQTAYKALEATFEALKPKLLQRAAQLIAKARAEGKSEDYIRALNRNLTYGLGEANAPVAASLHELAAEMTGNGVFRKFLRDASIASLNLETSPRLKLANFKNALAAIAGKFNRLLGIDPKLDNAFDTFYTAHQNVLNAVDDSHASAMRDVKRGLEQKGKAPDLSFLGEQAEPRASALADMPATGGEAPAAPQAPRNSILTKAKAWLSPKGVEPAVFHAGNTRKGITDLAALEGTQALTTLQKVITPENREHVTAALQGDVASLNKLDKQSRAVVGKIVLGNVDSGLKVVDAILANPNLNEEGRRTAATILDKLYSYSYRGYEADIDKNYLPAKLEAADRAAKAIAAKEKVSPGDMQAYESVDTLRKYLSSTYMGGIDDLKTKTTEQLEDIFKFHTARSAEDVIQKSLGNKAYRKALVASIVEKVRAYTDPKGVVEQMVKAAATLSKDHGYNKYFRNLRQSTYINSQLKDVPRALRQFWGEVSDPAVKQMLTIRARGEYMAELTALNQLREEGLSTGLFSTDRNNASHQVALDSDRHGPLQGLFTTPDVAEAINGFTLSNTAINNTLEELAKQPNLVMSIANIAASTVGAGIKRAAATAKIASVLGNPGNLLTNFGGSPFQLMANGNFDPRYAASGAKELYRIMRAEHGAPLSEIGRELILGKQLEYSQIHELQGNKLDAQADKLLKAALESGNPKGFLDSVKSGANTAFDGLQFSLDTYKQLYSAADLYSKVANYMYQKDFWTAHNAKHNKGMSAEEIRQLVLRRNNDTNITPSSAPKILKASEAVGATQFGTYYAEVARSTYNNFYYGVADLLAGIKHKEPDLAMHGAKRLLGLVGGSWGYSKLITAGVKASAGLLGLAATQLTSDDPRKKFMDKDAFWSSQEPLLLKNEDGTYGYDLTRPNPFAPIWNPASSILSAINSNDSKEAMTSAEKAVLGFAGLLSKNSMWKAFGEASKVYTGDKASVPRIARTAPTTYNDLSSMLTDAGVSANTANAVISAMTPFVPKLMRNAAEAADVKSPSMRAVIASGVGVNRFTPLEDVGSVVGKVSMAKIAKARAQYADLMKQNYTSSPERLEGAFKDAIDKAQEPYSNLQRAVAAAKKEGASRSKLYEQLKLAGVSDEMSGALLRNRPVPATILIADLNKDLERDVIASGDDPLKRREATRRYRYNMKMLSKLLHKYQTTNIGE